MLTSFCFKFFFSQDLHGRRVRVNYATEQPQRTFNNNYGSYGGGNYGGGYDTGEGYGSGGGYVTNVGGNQGGRNATYGGNDGNYVVQNTFNGGAGNCGIAGGGGGNDSYAGTNADVVMMEMLGWGMAATISLVPITIVVVFSTQMMHWM